MSIPHFSFELASGETLAERVARCATEVLTTAGGVMSNLVQHDYYKEFISCGEDKDISAVRTSCGIFVRAVLYHCGLKVPPAKIGQALIGGWVPFGMNHPSWIKYNKNQPTVGSICFVQSKTSPNNCHVLLIVEDLGNGTFRTAEGGSGDGTL